MEKVLLLILVSLLAGCANIPITTMFKFSSFDEDDFKNLNASSIRAKVEVSEPYTIKLKKTDLSVTSESERGGRNYQFPLVLLTMNKVTKNGGIFSSERNFTEYTFKISESGISEFKLLQETLTFNFEGKHHFSISTEFNEEAKGSEKVTISIHLKLDQAGEFITLIDEAEVEIEQDD